MKVELMPPPVRVWPPRIEVGDRVHWAVSSPDTGVVLKIQKNRRRARVQWDHNGVKWVEMSNIHSVTRSLTEWQLLRRGKTPCRLCGYEADGDGLCGPCRQTDAAREYLKSSQEER